MVTGPHIRLIFAMPKTPPIMNMGVHDVKSEKSARKMGTPVWDMAKPLITRIMKKTKEYTRFTTAACLANLYSYVFTTCNESRNRRMTKKSIIVMTAG